MASIHRRPRSKFWQCQYLDAEGKWQRVSTKKAAKDEALRWCLALQDAQNIIGSGDASEAQLRDIIDRAVEKKTGAAIAMPKVREWLNDWLEAKQGSNSSRTIDRYQAILDEFYEYLGARADGRLESIAQRDVIAYRKLLVSKGRVSTTVNLIVKIIGAPFRQAFQQGIIRHNPTAGIPRLKDSKKKRKKAFTVEQVKALRDSATGDWIGAILCGYTTGMRLSDVANLEEEAIDYGNDVIGFHQRKTQSVDDEATVVGLHPSFKDWLLSRPKPPKSGPIFPTLAGRTSAGRSGLSLEFSGIMDAAGIESDIIREKNAEGRQVRALTFHSFRHGAASNVFKGKLIEQAQKAVTGHVRGQTLKTYTHVDIEAVKAASAMIPKL